MFNSSKNIAEVIDPYTDIILVGDSSRFGSLQLFYYQKSNFKSDD